jgi:glycosyltransferase involved in cell wall biosynthesis
LVDRTREGALAPRAGGGSGRTIRVAVFAEVDMNLLDGSSVWVQSICQVLATLDGVRVSLLLRAPEERALLTDPLRSSGQIEVIDPRKLGHRGRLDAEQAVAALEAIDAEQRLDVLLLRGQAVSAAAARRPSFEGRLWVYHLPSPSESRQGLRALAEASRHLLCQTEAVRASLEAAVPEHSSKLILLPPMIPRLSEPRPDEVRAARPRGPRVVYAGKLAPEYGFSEMLRLVELLRERRPEAELHVIGDKIHDPPADRSFRPETRRRLEETPGLVWHGAVERTRVHELISGSDFALSLRDPLLDSSLELSTKVLEYGAAGVPAVLNRTTAHEELLGDDYPLFADRAEDAFEAIEEALRVDCLRTLAIARCRRASRGHTFAEVAGRLAPHLREASGSGRPPAGEARRLVIAGHDLKFAGEVHRRASWLGAEVRHDRWRGHSAHSPSVSADLLSWADTVLCEWCLGNAVHYSRKVGTGQRLFIRFHRMELETSHPSLVDLDTVSAVVFVAQHVLDSAAERFSWPRDKLRVTPNVVDVRALDRPKLPGSAFNLAMVGFVPQLKRLDRALDLVEGVRARDPRFRLILKGHEPMHYPWVMSRPSEMEFFREQYQRIATSPLLRGAVSLEPFGHVPSFLRKVGVILSTSDVEGDQVSLAEGMASGAVPVVLDRPGARADYGDRWVHGSVDAAAASLLEAAATGQLDDEGAAASAYAARWSPEAVLPRWDELLDPTSAL